MAARHFLPLLAALAVLSFALVLVKLMRLGKLRVWLAREWGRPQARERDFERIALLHKYAGKPRDGARTVVDDHTWQDLGPFFHIISSISEVDSLVRGESYYLVQAKRLLTMIRASEQEAPALCIIDELLNGTNSTERLAASAAILEYLAGRNARLIVSTHDLELAEKLSASFQCYHFSDEIDDTGLKFDFKLKEGVSKTRNAIRLLAQLGYPEEIVSTARNATRR